MSPAGHKPRRSPRIESRFQISVRCAGKEYNRGLHTRDLSDEGMKLLFPNVCPLRAEEAISGVLTLLPADLETETLELQFSAKVIWSRDRECGVEYRNMNDEDRALYQRLLKSIQHLQNA